MYLLWASGKRDFHGSKIERRKIIFPDTKKGCLIDIEQPFFMNSYQI